MDSLGTAWTGPSTTLTWTSRDGTINTAGTGVPADLTSSLTGAQRDAFAALSHIFEEYGLGSLAPAIADFLRKGYSADTISILLRDTTEYKQRFSANEVRRQKGLPALSPAEYLATERSYRQIIHAAGLPVGFYDSTSDFQKFLENDISPQELQERVNAASDFINKASAEDRAFFSQWYSQGDMIAFALDPDKAAPLVGRAYSASRIAGAADRSGFDINQDYAERIANLGVTADQAAQGFGTIQRNIGNDMKLAAISGVDLTAQDEMNELFFADAATTLKREKLTDQEAARFGGSSAVSGSSLGTSSAGQL